MQEFKKFKDFNECPFCTCERGLKDRIYKEDYTVSMLGDEIEIGFNDEKVIELLPMIYIPVKFCPMCGERVDGE